MGGGGGREGKGDEMAVKEEKRAVNERKILMKQDVRRELNVSIC